MRKTLVLVTAILLVLMTISPLVTNQVVYAAAPIVTSISPSSGPAVGGTSVTITGAEMVGNMTVTVGGASATGVTFIDFNHITAVTPAGVAGPQDVVVTNLDTSEFVTVAGGFTYYAVPAATSVLPNSGPAVGGTSVTVSGTNLAGATNVNFGSTAAVFTINSSTEIIATSPAGIGTVHVTVTTPGGISATSSADQFTYVASPTVTAISPNSGPLSGGTSVTITGSNFVSGAAVSIGGTPATGVNVVNSNTINATAPAGSAGAKNVTVTNPDSQSGTLTGGFNYVPPPSLSTVSPNYGTQGQTLNSVIITGSYFNNANSPSFGVGITINSYTVNSDTQITAAITIAAGTTPGSRDISVTTPGGTGTLTGAFTILELQTSPTVSTVYPSSGVQGQALTGVLITGTSLNNASAISFGAGITVTKTGNTETQITVDLTIDANAAPGYRTVSVTTPGGTGTRTNGFTVVQAAPTITTVAPDDGIQGQTLNNIIITGTHLYNTSSLNFGTGMTIDSFVVNSDTQITVNVTISSIAATGLRNVLVTTPGGTGTLTNGFTVHQPAPAITSISPNEGDQGQTIAAVSIVGSHFTDASTVSFGDGITVNTFTVNSDTQITASITINPTATTGFRNLSVTTMWGGTTSLTNGFTVLQSITTITSVSPTNGIQGQTLTVIITGTYLNDATNISFGNQITVNSYLVNSATKITADITIAEYATPGSYDVLLTAPLGTASLPGGFTIKPAPPIVKSITPNSGVRGQTVFVNLYGNYFSSTNNISFGTGITVKVIPFGVTWIVTKLEIDTNATPGKRDVSVTTPAGTVTVANGFTVSEDVTSIKVVYPNGGEIWEIGTDHTITWTSAGISGVTGGITIQLSRDGGASWKTLIVSTNNSGFYSWKVTGPATNEGRIKILSTVYPDTFDISDLNFIIPAPTIQVNAPSAGAVWNIGTQQTISWKTSSSVTGKIKIQFSRDGGETWKTIVSSTKNDGIHSWKVAGPPTNLAKIKIISLSNPTVISEEDFVISAGVILTTSPDGGENWQVGTKQTITWVANGVTAKIMIQLSRDGGETWKTIVSSTKNDGVQTWKVSGPPTNQARIRVLNKSYQTVYDISDGNFSISY